MKSEKKGLVKREETLPSTELHEGDWGSEGMQASDVLIPKLLLMQGQSDLVNAGKATAGDIVKSTTGEVVASRGEPLAIIPIMTSKSWRIMEAEGQRFEFRRMEEWTVENDKRVLEWEEKGTKWRADRTLNFYVMLPKDIVAEREVFAMLDKGQTPENVSILTPCLLQFVRTSYNAGKKLITHFAMARQFRRPPAAWWLNLSSDATKNDQGHYYVFNVEAGGLTAIEDLRKCREWYDIIRATDVKIHEPETAEECQPVEAVNDPNAKF